MWLRRLGYIVILIAIGWIAMLYKEYALFALLVLGVSLLPVCLGYLLFLRKKVSVFVERSGRPASEAGAVVMRLCASNRAKIPTGPIRIRLMCRDVFFGIEKKTTISLQLAGGGAYEEELTLRLDHCGAVEVSVVKGKVYDLLGLFGARAEVDNTKLSFVVFPKRYPTVWFPGESPESLPSDLSVRTCPRPGDDPAELYDVREYRQGDKLNRIHWNLSAAKDELYVKELGMPPVISTVMYVELWRSDKGKKMYDALMETVFSLSSAWLGAGLAHFITWYDAEIKQPMRGVVEKEEDLYQVIEQLLTRQGYTSMAEGAGPEAYFRKYAGERYHMLCFVGEKSRRDACMAFYRGSGQSTCHFFALQERGEEGGSVQGELVEMPIDTSDVAGSLARLLPTEGGAL